jgi:hypothetical protein
VYEFLQALPALVGFIGFFVYLWAGQQKSGGNVFSKIVDRLRQNPNVDIRSYGSMTPAKLRHLIAADEKVRSTVNEQDRELLKLVIQNQSRTTLIVFVVCAALVALGVWLVRTDPLRPRPVQIGEIRIGAIEKQAEGLLVDLDPLQVSWRADGDEEVLSVCLENLSSGAKTRRKSVVSSARTVNFLPQDLAPLLEDRSYKGVNRIRALVETSRSTFSSRDVDILVGIRASLMIGGTLISQGEERGKISTLFATIDDSTEHVPSGYCFQGDFFAFDVSGAAVVQALRSCNSDGEVRLSKISDINWNRPHGFIYHGPDDPRLIRSDVAAPVSQEDGKHGR